MMLYKKIKEIVHSADLITNFFNIFTGILPGDTLAPYEFVKLSWRL